MAVARNTTKVQTQIRMSDEMRARIEAYQRKLQRDNVERVTFTAAVRALLERGLRGA